MPLLGYGKKWQNFEEVIKKAMTACKLARIDVGNHFIGTKKEVVGGKGAIRKIADYHLTFFAFHSTLLFADIKKPEIARTLAYCALLSRNKPFEHPLLA